MAASIGGTNLAVDNLVYVVDSRLPEQLIFNPHLRLNTLEMRPISQTLAKQLASRAGKMDDGICYRLYSKEDCDRLDPFIEPAIRYVSLDSAILKLETLGHRKIIDFDWISTPLSID